MRHTKSHFLVVAVAAFLLFTMLACVRVGSKAANSPLTAQYIPSTIVPTAIPPTPTSAPTATVDPAISCEKILSYMDDLTIPDGTVVGPGASVDKQWEVRNSGTCNWGEGYTFRLIYGSEMGADPVQPLPSAEAGSQVVIQILFTAPDQPGFHQSAWQAFDPRDNPFGDEIYIEIQVDPSAGSN